MEEENLDAQEVLEIPVEEPIVPEAEEPEETVESLKDKNAKLFARAKKAEGFELVNGEWVKVPKPVEKKPAKKEQELSTIDTYALVQAQVPLDDIEDVQKAAKLLGVSIAESLKDPIVKSVLERKEALRKTAEASNINTARPSSKKVSDETIMKEALEGKIPEKGSSEAERLFWARHGGKK